MEKLNAAGIKTKGKLTVDPRPLEYENVKCNLLEKSVSTSCIPNRRNTRNS